MDNKDENSPSNLWTRRSNTKTGLSVTKNERSETRDPHDTPSVKRFGSVTGMQGKGNPFNALGQISTASVASPTATSGASTAFGLGSGAFGFGGAPSGKTPKTASSAFDVSGKPGGEKKESGQGSDKDEKDKEKASRRPPARKSLSALRQPSTSTTDGASTSSKDGTQPWPLRHAWVIHYRPPTSKNSDYEKSIKPMCRMASVQDFWVVYTHLRRPSDLPTVSDYHFFKEGIRPVWEDDENKHGGKWIMRLKKGVADRYWEDLLLAMIGDQFAEASDEVCGAVVSVRSGEDIFSIWTKNDGGRNVKIRETIKRVLALPPDTNLQWRSHDESITQRHAVDHARQEKVGQMHGPKRRNTLGAEKAGKMGDEEASD